MKILLVNNKILKSTLLMGDKVAAKLGEAGIEVLIDSSPADITSESFDAIMVLGGDGTMIRAARQYLERNVPVLGVNMGTVGFLSSIGVEELDQYLDRFIQGDYDLEERMMLEVRIYQGKNLVDKVYSLNEVSLKSNSARVINIDVRIGGREHALYRGDGMVVATPSGSTAYSLSCGGPITDPALDVFIMTPITSYLLNKRPMIIAADKEIELIPVRAAEALISIDGQVKIEGKENSVIKINKAQPKLKLVNMRPRHFFQTIMKRLQRNGED
ncbi:MAG: NAD(+)/NADH kinase [Syntrophomonadaceae bacterium]|nr:NAD(+)/NADH kinase [Syntrophomonadaceae bacterium]